MRNVRRRAVEYDIGISPQHLAQHAVSAVPPAGERQRTEKLDAVPPLPETRKRVPGNYFGTYGMRA